MALGDAKPTVISIIVYIIVIVAGAVILMFMEKEGMKKTVKNEEERPTNASLMQSRPKNLTQHAKEYLENHGAKKWTTIDVAKLLKEIDSFRSKKRDNDAEDKSKSWRQKIDLGTFAKWEYFVVGTVSTIGKIPLFVVAQCLHLYQLAFVAFRDMLIKPNNRGKDDDMLTLYSVLHTLLHSVHF